MVKEAPSIAN